MCHEFDGHVELEESFFLSPSFSLMLIWACGHWRLLMFIYIFCSWNFLGHYNAWLVILLNIIYSCFCIGCWIGKQYSYRVGYLSTGIKFPGNINHWVAGMRRCPSRIEYISVACNVECKPSLELSYQVGNCLQAYPFLPSILWTIHNKERET